MRARAVVRVSRWLWVGMRAVVWVWVTARVRAKVTSPVDVASTQFSPQARMPNNCPVRVRACVRGCVRAQVCVCVCVCVCKCRCECVFARTFLTFLE